MDSQFNYTVIIPFRDCTGFLRKACSSIPVRDDIQVIVVDNAQNPIGENALIDFDNPNIEYYTSSPVKGAGCARNEGLKHALGKYLLFLDADDYFAQDAFSAFDAELESDCDIIFFNATSIFLDTGDRSDRHCVIDKYIKESLKTGNEDVLRYHFVNPVCKMVSRSLVENNNIKFQEVRVSNDLMFSTWTGHYANKIKSVNKVVYVITEGEVNSSLTRIKSRENQFIRFQVAIDHYHFVKNIGRDDLTFRLSSYIFHAIKDFGIKEGIKWAKYAIAKKVNFLKL